MPRLWVVVLLRCLALGCVITYLSNCSAQTASPATSQPSHTAQSCADADPIPIATEGTKRLKVNRNYLVVIYDARSGQVAWYDYASQQRGRTSIIRMENRSVFTPVTYNKERILVRVCGIKFNSTVTISPTSTQIPENTLDIRGVPSAAAAPSLGAQAPTGGAPTGPAAVAAAAAEAPPATKIIAPQNVERIAQQAATYYLTYEAIRKSIVAIACENPDDLSNCPLDTVPSIEHEAEILSNSLSSASPENQGVFNSLFISTQKLVADLTNLSTSLTSANLLGGVVQLTSTFSSLSTGTGAADPSVLAAVDPNSNQSNRDRINARLRLYLPPGHAPIDISDILSRMPPGGLIAQVNALNDQLDGLRKSASTVFATINDLHDRSNIDITNVLTPMTNGVITIQITVQDNYVPFGFSNAPAAVIAAGGTAASAASSTPQLAATPAKPGPPKASQTAAPVSPTVASATPSPAPQHVDAQVQIEVHHKADFNVVAGFAAVAIRQQSFGLVPSKSAFVPFMSQDQRFSLQPIVGLNWYPGGRDFYPTYLGKRRWIPGILFGTSFTSTSTFMGGPNFEFVNGLDLYGGIAVGNETQLAKGVTLGVTQFTSSSATVPTTQNLKPGAFFGLGFDLSVFSSIFKSH